MQTALADFVRHTPQGIEADAILRSCVHCGFCNATCPTYQILGDELDGPRGRIYLIKEMLEGRAVSRRTLTHLDRCLTCRNCETTCPSGVRYGRLLDIGRELIEPRVERPWFERLQRWALRKTIPYPARFTPWLRLGQFVRPLMPGFMKRSIPAWQMATAWPAPCHARKMLVLEGCVQPAMAPNINLVTARVLDRLGISLIAVENAGCCGALHHHTSDPTGALDFARRNIDAWWPAIEAGAEAIVMTASGCGGARERLRPFAPARFRLCRQGAACCGANPGYQRDSGQGKSVGAETRERGREARLPCALHVAARTEAHWRGGKNIAGRGIYADTGPGRASVLRVGGYLFPAATGAGAAPA